MSRSIPKRTRRRQQETGCRLPKQELTRKTQFIRKSFRDEYLEDLVESGELAVSPNSKGGTIYSSGD